MATFDNRIYLASRSPRRRELLKQIGVAYELLLYREDARRGPDVDERPEPAEAASDYVLRVARSKAETAWRRVTERKLPHRPVLAADTAVVLDERILGKPAGREQAAEMLSQLSDRVHQVLTAVAVHDGNALKTALSASEVEFRELSAQEIRRYLAGAEAYDKAGAYAVQGRAAVYIRRLSGSYSGVVGLPLYETAELLREFGIEP
ncbi:MAG TPA: Maf family protein [Burkholderiales bacterium]|nr:Maf family protein [Burkholderiales bacterium]